MICTTIGGTVSSLSLTGPDGLQITDYTPVGTRNYRGQDSYRASTGTRTGGSDGDTYQCTATNGVLAPNGSSLITLRGTTAIHTPTHTHTHMHTHTHKHTHACMHAHTHTHSHRILCNFQMCYLYVAHNIYTLHNNYYFVVCTCVYSAL